jgi:hypothetical protein
MTMNEHPTGPENEHEPLTEPTTDAVPEPLNDPTTEPLSDPTTEPLITQLLTEPVTPAGPARPPRRVNTHPVNVLHLVMGVAFLGITFIWALVEGGAAGASDLRWLLPIPWVAAGIAGLVATAPRLRGPREEG